MSQTVALIHAVQPAMPPMRETLARELPDVKVLNLLDEGLLSEVERYGGLSPECVDRLSTQVGLAISAGADAVLLTCTVYSPAVEQVQERFPRVPILPVDQVMIDRAIELARVIGVLATVAAGLEQQQALLGRAAERAGKDIQIVPSLHPEAFAALQRGDGAEHDRVLLDALRDLAGRSELVLLAQASMARLVPRLPTDLRVPVLASPTLVVERLREILSS
jgi:Asp/Glu/hydantoin racemase